MTTPVYLAFLSHGPELAELFEVCLDSRPPNVLFMRVMCWISAGLVPGQLGRAGTSVVLKRSRRSSAPPAARLASLIQSAPGPLPGLSFLVLPSAIKLPDSTYCARHTSNRPWRCLSLAEALCPVGQPSAGAISQRVHVIATSPRADALTERIGCLGTKHHTFGNSKSEPRWNPHLMQCLARCTALPPRKSCPGPSSHRVERQLNSLADASQIELIMVKTYIRILQVIRFLGLRPTCCTEQIHIWYPPQLSTFSGGG